MARDLFRRLMPSPDWVRSNPTLARLGPMLWHPRLWRLSRRAVAGGVAIGFFSAFIIPVGQFFLAALGAITFRANLPIALVSTLITNPLTYAPWYWLAYEIGGLFMPTRAPSVDQAGDFLDGLLDGIAGLGGPLIAGLLVLAVGSALLGWLAVSLAWRYLVLRRWKLRRRRARCA